MEYIENNWDLNAKNTVDRSVNPAFRSKALKNRIFLQMAIMLCLS